MAKILEFLAGLIPYGQIIGIIAIGASAYVYVHHQGAVAERTKQAKIIEKEVKIHDKIETKDTSLPSAALNKAMQKWYRD